MLKNQIFQLSKRIFRKTTLLFLINLSLFIYLFIVFLPLPEPIRTGLDPSWSYGIAHATQKQLIFGQDLIFTYGPLGYLVASPVLNDDFLKVTFFRWIIYFVTIFVFLSRVVTIKNHVQQIFLFLSIALAILIGIGVDYQIVFIFLTILSFNDVIRKNLPLTFLLLGCISGFGFLAKFTLGLYTLGMSISYLLVSCCQSIIRRYKPEFSDYFFALINCVLGCFSVALIFLSPHLWLSYLAKIVTNLVVAGAIGASIWLIQKQIKSRSEYRLKTVSKSSSILKNDLLLPQLIFYMAYFSLLIYNIFSTQSPSLIDFFTNSWEISSGYSSAMSIVGKKFELTLAISEIFLIICIMFFATIEGHINLSLSYLISLFISFKHGFVRQDGHVIIFAIVAPLITSLLILKISRWRYQKISYYFFIYVLIASLLTSLPIINSQKLDIISRLMPEQIATKVIKIARKNPKQSTFDRLNYISEINSNKFNIEELQSRIKQESLNNLAEVQLPESVKKLVDGKTIDIIPWEISLVPANQLNWKPRPIFQSYSAYTESLDRLNFESYVKEPRDYIFYDFTSIDQRHPFFDEPKTFFHVFCNYQPSSDISSFINTQKLSNLVLLEKHKDSRCSSSFLSDALSITWNTSYSIENTNEAITRASIKFNYSPVGKIYKTLFRAPPVMIKINYIDGDQRTYRIIPENSENGVIVSHLPRNPNEALSFLQGQLPSKVSSFSFQTSNSLLYAPNIEMVFTSDILSRSR